MNVFDGEILRFWKIASLLHLKYIITGAVATNLHGYCRATADIDIWIEDSVINREKLRRVFREYGLGDFEVFKNMAFLPWQNYFYLFNGIRLNINTSIRGLEDKSFDSYLQLASIATIYDINIPFLDLNHLIDSKKAANSQMDQTDLIELEKIKNMLENENNDLQN